MWLFTKSDSFLSPLSTSSRLTEKDPLSCHTLQSLRVKIRALTEKYSSFLLRNIPEKGDAKILSSHWAWALQQASLPQWLMFLPQPAGKK